jgi:Fe-S-cluster containining protein
MMGPCQKCGTCCKYLVMHPSWFNYDLKHIEIRGGKIINGKIFFYHPCKELTLDNLCGIYETRPRLCRPDYETHYAELKVLGCQRQFGTEQDDPNVIKVHMSEAFGTGDRILQ